jgi:hypothetical protein
VGYTLLLLTVTLTLCKLYINYGPVQSFPTNLGLDQNIQFQNKRPDRLQFGPNFFENYIKFSLEYKDQTV